MALTKKKRTNLVEKVRNGEEFKDIIQELEIGALPAAEELNKVSNSIKLLKIKDVSRLVVLKDKREKLLSKVARVEERIAKIEAALQEESDPE